jgi:PleD family two-component response regulator
MAAYSTKKGQLLVIWITSTIGQYIAEIISEDPLKLKVTENGPLANLKDGDFGIKEEESAEIQDDAKSILLLRRFTNSSLPLKSGLKKLGVTDNRLHQILAPKRILIINNNEPLRIILTSDLAEEGYLVDSASNLSEGLAKLAESPFDLAIVDPFSRLNDRSAETKNFLKNFSDEPRPCPYLLVLTGFLDLKNAITAKKYGVNDVIAKPFDLVELLDTIRDTLNGLRPIKK